MSKSAPIRALFVDIGGVFLTNGWDHDARAAAAIKFKLSLPEMEDRHRLAFDTYEVGKMSIDEYLDTLVFYQPRRFSRKEFLRFIHAQTKPYPEMIALVSRLKKKYGLKVGVVSNEGRELNDYRIKKFRLTDFVDFFVSSSFVHLRKPDAEIFRLALDLIQVPPGQIAYLEDRQLFVDVAERFGIHGVLVSDLAATRRRLAALGLKD